MEIIFVRHTSVGVPRGVCYGYTDVPVSDNFKTEVNWLVDRIGNYNPSKVFSSPLSRCKDLAAAVYDGCTPELVDDLKELNYGDWEGVSWDNIGVEESSDWMYENSEVMAPNGESFSDLKNRVSKFLYEITELNLEKVVVFCHGGVVRSILSEILDVPLKQTKSLKIYYAAHIKIIYEESRWKLTDLNGGYY